MKRYILFAFLQCALLSNSLYAIDWPQFKIGAKKSAKKSALLGPCAMLVHSLYNGARYAKAKFTGENTTNITKSWIKDGATFTGAITGLVAFCGLVTALDKRCQDNRAGKEKSKYTGKAVANGAVLSGLALAGWAYLKRCAQKKV